MSPIAYPASFQKHVREADILGGIPLRSDAWVGFRAPSRVSRPLREGTRKTISAICYLGVFGSARCLAYLYFLLFETSVQL